MSSDQFDTNRVTALPRGEPRRLRAVTQTNIGIMTAHTTMQYGHSSSSS